MHIYVLSLYYNWYFMTIRVCSLLSSRYDALRRKKERVSLLSAYHLLYTYLYINKCISVTIDCSNK